MDKHTPSPRPSLRDRPPGFDYETVDAETRVVLDQARTRLQDLERRTSQSILEIGRTLIEIKGRLGHGLFGVWLAAEFGWSARTAQRFMQVAEMAKYDNLSDLVDGAESSALYTLAAPSTPDAVREGMAELAKLGKPIRNADVREALAEDQTRRTEQATVDRTTGELVEEDEEIEGEVVIPAGAFIGSPWMTDTAEPPPAAATRRYVTIDARDPAKAARTIRQEASPSYVTELVAMLKRGAA